MNGGGPGPSNGGLRSRLFGFGTATVLIFGAIRLGIALLRPYAEPPHGATTAIRSESRPPPRFDRSDAKREAQAKLLTLAHEANASRAPKAASAAYEAERALGKEDCPAAQSAVARAGDGIASDDPLRSALESAGRAVTTFCEMGGD